MWSDTLHFSKSSVPALSRSQDTLENGDIFLAQRNDKGAHGHRGGRLAHVEAHAGVDADDGQAGRPMDVKVPLVVPLGRRRERVSRRWEPARGCCSQALGLRVPRDAGVVNAGSVASLFQPCLFGLNRVGMENGG